MTTITQNNLESQSYEADKPYMIETPMEISEIAQRHDRARQGVVHWIEQLESRLGGNDEIQVCEATRMLVFFARHYRMTSAILSRKKVDCSVDEECLRELDKVAALLRRASDVVQEVGRKERIQKRLDLVTEFRDL